MDKEDLIVVPSEAEEILRKAKEKWLYSANDYWFGFH